MLMRIKITGRRCIALLWAMSLIFAVAPALSMAAHAGTFSSIVVHAHDQGEAAHSHHEHVHDHDGQDRHLGSSDVDDGPGQNRLHVHHDACCASMFMLMPTLTAAMLEHRVSDALGMPQTQPIQGSSPDNLLRPPIFHPYL
jgi:hypothetical protein